MSRLIGFAITGLAVYLALNSLPDFSSRDSHVMAVAIATDNREGIAADLKNITEPARSFSAANPLIAQPKLVQKGTTGQVPAERSGKPSLNPFRTVATEPVLKTQPVVSASAKPQLNEKITARNVELASLDTHDDIQPVLIKAASLAPPKYENVLLETQRELKRIGCYKSRLDGIWGKGSRWALRRFVIRSKTIALSDKEKFRGVPSSVLLEQLRKTSHRVCGRPCGSGRMLSAKGRCVNDPVITASLATANPWGAEVKRDDTPSDVQTTVIRGAAVALEKPAVKKAKKRARRNWRKKRYALGGPRYERKRSAKSRRYVRRSYRKWRKYRRNAWKRRILNPDD